MLQVQTTEVAGQRIQVLADRRDSEGWGGDKGFGKMGGDVDEYVATCSVSLGLMAEGKTGDERETLRVGGLGKLALHGTQEDEYQTLALIDLKHW